MFSHVFSMLADKLNMSPDDAEKWIVNLIRNARLDAKIDSQLVSEIYSAYDQKYYWVLDLVKIMSVIKKAEI